MKTKLFNYSGTKINNVDLVNRILNRTNKRVYVEPFVGSGAVLFNLEKQFDKCFVNDVDSNVVRMFKSFKICEYADVLRCRKRVLEFGDVKRDKTAFLNFRNWFNENCFKNDTLDEGLFLVTLANTCFSSFLRFNNNGMSQSFGNRNYEIQQPAFDRVQHVLSKTEMLNTSYENLFDIDGCFFLDPPYASQASSYAPFSKQDLTKFVERLQILQTKNDFIYTDIENEINSVMTTQNVNKITIRNMKSTSPTNSGLNRGHVEVLFTNLGAKTEQLNW